MALRELEAYGEYLEQEIRAGHIEAKDALARMRVQTIAATTNALAHGKGTMLREIGKRPWLVLTPLVLGFVLGLLTHIWF